MMPSSSRLYMAPDGQAETHAGLRQCSQIRGRWNMKVFSNSNLTFSTMFLRFGSWSKVSPPSESSQLAPQVIDIGSPVSFEYGCLTGVSLSPAGALTRMSLSKVAGS